MTATVHKLETKTHRVVYDGPRKEELGDCASRTAATHERSQSSLSPPLRVSVELSRGRSTVRPTFTCRTHKAPVPHGHRQWLKLEGRG